LGWEEVEYLFKRLRYLAYAGDGSYQLEWERRMFLNRAYPELRLLLVKWGTYEGADKPTKREVLSEAYKPSDMVPVLLMLIAVATDRVKELSSREL